MTAAAPAIIPDLDDQPRPRLRLIALALAGWHDHVPMSASRVRGESGSGEPTTVSGRTSTRRRDELLLRLERPMDGDPIKLDAYRAQRRPGDLERQGHPCWVELDRAMAMLHGIDPGGHRLIVDVLVADPLPGTDWRHVVAAIHALPYIRGGLLRAVDTPKYRLIRALTFLDEQLPANLTWPREIHEQVEGWSAWLAGVKGAGSAKQQRSSSYRAACRLRDRHVRELADLAGWSQQRIARELGVTQQAVSKALKRTESKDELAPSPASREVWMNWSDEADVRSGKGGTFDKYPGGTHTSPPKEKP